MKHISRRFLLTFFPSRISTLGVASIREKRELKNPPYTVCVWAPNLGSKRRLDSGKNATATTLYEDINDHRSYIHNSSSCEIKEWMKLEAQIELKNGGNPSCTS